MTTNDAGRTWVHYQPPDGTLDAFSFINEQQGWAVINGAEVWRTADGGQSWKAIGEVSRADGASHGPIHTIRFIDERNGWIIASSGIWRTGDGGAQWREQVVDASPNRSRGVLYNCYFVDSNLGWLTGTRGTVSKTEDGGRTWQSQNIPPEDGDIRDISFVNDHTGWLAVVTNWKEPGAGIYATQDGGTTWNPRRIAGKNLQITSVCFVNEREGWVAGIEVLRASSGETSHAALLHTENGGREWEVLYNGERSSIGDRVYFANSQCGWLLVRSDSSDSVYRTVDGGRTLEESLRLALVGEEVRALHK